MSDGLTTGSSEKHTLTLLEFLVRPILKVG
jgi:hypothetical protein